MDGVDGVKGGGQTPPTLCKMGRKYHHHRTNARKYPSTVYCTLSLWFESKSKVDLYYISPYSSK
jgi:hypothetical protein